MEGYQSQNFHSSTVYYIARQYHEELGVGAVLCGKFLGPFSVQYTSNFIISYIPKLKTHLERAGVVIYIRSLMMLLYY